MSAISVVTAVDPRRADHLAMTWNSLALQVMPPGWSWEWLVQCDSTDPGDQQAVRQHVPDHPQVSFAASRRGGPAIARTMTLARARGRLIKTLDADDRLTEGALARDIVAHSNPGVLWSASHVVNEHPDGEREDHYPWDPPGGRIRSGTAYAAYKQGWRILVHPATLCISYLTLVALGGWMALPASEDTALLMALDACGDGFFIPETGMIYRRWPPQMSASAEHVEPYELDARRTLVLQRAQAVSDWVAGHSKEVDGADFPVRTLNVVAASLPLGGHPNKLRHTPRPESEWRTHREWPDRTYSMPSADSVLVPVARLTRGGCADCPFGAGRPPVGAGCWRGCTAVCLPVAGVRPICVRRFFGGGSDRKIGWAGSADHEPPRDAGDPGS